MLNEFISLTTVAMKLGKEYYFSYHSRSCKEGKILHQRHEFYTFELPLIKLNQLDKY